MVIPLQTRFQSSGSGGSLLPAWLRQAGRSRGAYLCVCTGLSGHLLRAEIPQNGAGGKFHKLTGTSVGSFFFFFLFHVVWRDNLDILTLGPVSSKIFKSKSPLVPGCIAEGPWYPPARCAGDHPPVPARASRAEGRQEIRLYP